MTGPSLAHPTPQQLASFAQGRMSATELAEIEFHVATCDVCCRQLRGVPDDTLVQRLRNVGTPLVSSAPRTADIPPELANHTRYRVVRLLGSGGMGTVYQAVHRLMERDVALKILMPELINHPTAAERFRLEVKAAARLAHPNIVTAYDAEQAGSLHFLVMEYVEGMSLSRLIEKRGPVSAVHASHYIRQAAQGLQHAHERGMVHRDVKPHNLMLTRQGRVKILDFGLARLSQERRTQLVREAGAAQPSRPGLTAVGTVVGTPDYMSPEQASDSGKVDIRADIYSLGCTLYFLLAGRPPFPDGTSMEKMLSHLDGEPTPLGELRAGLPEGLTDVVRRMMAKDPAARFQSPGEVAVALTPFARPAGSAVAEPVPLALEAETLAAEPPRRRRPRRLGRRPLLVLLGLTGLGLLLIAGGLLVWGLSRLGGGAAATGPAVARRLRVLYVLPPQFWNEDYEPVCRVLEAKGVRVEVACSQKTCTPIFSGGKQGTPFAADLVLTGPVKTEEYDAVVFAGFEVRDYLPGGVAGPQVARMLLDFRKDVGHPRYVTGLCVGVSVLAQHKALEGKKVAANDKVRNAAPNCGARWVDDPVMRDGRIITAAMDSDAKAFAEELLRALGR